MLVHEPGLVPRGEMNGQRPAVAQPTHDYR